MNIVIAVLVFGVIVVIHELGHFIAAKNCGILVEEFAIGMGPKLFGIKCGETVFSLRLFPIGGSCRMLGEEPETEKPDKKRKKGEKPLEIDTELETEAEIETEIETEPQDDTPQDEVTAPAVLNERSFLAKPVYKRIIVIIAGIVMNLLLALVVMGAFYSKNAFYLPGVDSVIPGLPAEAAGLKPGDMIRSVNGARTRLFNDVYYAMSGNSGQTVDLEIIRSGKRLSVTITPAYVEEEGRYMIGFSYARRLGLFEKASLGWENVARASLGETLGISFNTCVYYVKSTFDGLGKLFTRKANISDFSGPIGIVSYIGDTYEQSVSASSDPWDAFWNIMMLVAALSANLAVFNFLPIPALDGGRLIFLIAEGIRGKPVSPEREGMVHFAGFVLLMIFAVFVAYSDIMKLI